MNEPLTSNTGVGEYCTVGPASEQVQKFMLIFEDKSRGMCIYSDEQEARSAFTRAEALGWNCHLFGLLRRAVEPKACNHGAISPKGTMFYHGFVDPRVNIWRCGVCKGLYEGNLTEPNTLGSQALTLIGPAIPSSDVPPFGRMSREALAELCMDWTKANAPGGWIDDLRKRAAQPPTVIRETIYVSDWMLTHLRGHNLEPKDQHPHKVVLEFQRDAVTKNDRPLTGPGSLLREQLDELKGSES